MRHTSRVRCINLTIAAIITCLYPFRVFGSTADHSQFEELNKPFKSGPEVTAACLTCHTEAANQIHQTPHWSWKKKIESGKTLGKKNVINNFCVGIASNEPRCTSCHVGYGYTDSSFDFSQQEAVDCLVCHDTSNLYFKFPTDAGHPNYVPKEWPKGSGNIRQPVDLSQIAQSVGTPTRENCGSCHYNGGGGDGVKHGDLDTSLNNPSRSLDVHMSEAGAGLACQSCHTADGHVIDGSRFDMTASDPHGIDYPGHTDDGRASCASCHGNDPHLGKHSARLNQHAKVVACQTCHIPEFARENPTKTRWDWSTGGRMSDKGKPIVQKDSEGNITYMSKKGDFEWQKNVVPEYAWFNGKIGYTTIGETIEPTDEAYPLTQLDGSSVDKNSRIWPFKVMRSKQPYDPINKVLIIPHLFGKDSNAYWKHFNWERAAAAGQKAAGVDFSGEVAFIETTYHWPITHMVAPKEDALACKACHSQNSRLADVEGLYLPGVDNNHWLDKIGWLLVWLTFAGVAIHGFGRVITRSKRG